MKPSIILTLGLFLSINYVTTLNILGIYPHQGKSHFFQFKIYLNELVNRGHNVTVLSYFPDKNPPPNYRDILVADTSILEDEVQMFKSLLMTFGTGLYLSYIGWLNCKAMVMNTEVQDLIKNKAKFDVIVLEQFNSDCALGIAHKLGAPVVAMTSSALLPFHYDRLGIPSNQAYVPNHFLEGGTKPSLYQRVERFIVDTYYSFEFRILQWIERYTIESQFGDIPHLDDLAREVKILLIYQHFSLTGSRLLPANVIEVGGYHVSKAKPVTGDLKKFMDEAEHGVVFISFGSLLKCTSISATKLQAMIDAINEIPQRVIWRWDGPPLNVDKNKLFTSKWLPQVDILAHPKTLAFMSHAGMGGVAEAIHYGVPLLAVPIFADQPTNAFAAEESGLGVFLDYNYLTKETLLDSFRKVLDPKFREGAKEVSRLWHDRPVPPLDTAIYWTEYVARNSNFTLRTAAADTPLYQHWNLDIAAVFIIFFLLMGYGIKTLRKSKRKQPSKPDSKNKKPKRK